MVLLISFWFTVSLFVALPLCFSAAVYERFTECSRPFVCGSFTNLHYPFWGNGRAEYCGHPDFKLDCKEDKPVEMDTGSQSYRVLSIEDKILRMIPVESWNGDCPSPSQNISLPSPVFNYNLPSTINLTLAYGCPSKPQANIYPCPLDNTPGENYWWVDPAITRPDFSDCDVTVIIPVLQGRVQGQNIMRGNVKSILDDGFEVLYDANNTFCGGCELSQGQCGYNATTLAPTCFCYDGQYQGPCPNRRPQGRKGSNVGKILIGVGAAVGTLLLTCIAIILYRRHKRNRSSSSSALISRDLSRDNSLKPDPEKGSLFFQTKLFTYKELDEATNHFDSNKELGDGGFGTVYHGKLRDGRVVAVKRLFEHNYKRVEQFMNEIEILSRLRHQNLVSLYGCTSRHSRELLLVYEFVPNGTVADHLHGELAKDGLLTWPIRMSIAIQSADALAYLHASEIIHRDVKTNNILLDNNFHVKVADFGLSRLFPTDVTHVSTAPQGTPGYVDPEYYQCYQLTNKSDVYSFGVVLIELISSKPAVDIGRHRHEINLANLAINRIQHQALHELVDPSLGYDTDYSVRNMITLVAELAFRCLQQENEMRPCMTEVLEILRGIENDEYEKRKADDMDTSAVARLLKNSEPLSPDTVTGKWPSKESTPNTSG